MNRDKIPLVVGWAAYPGGEIRHGTAWAASIAVGHDVAKIRAKVGARDLWLWCWKGRPVPQSGSFGFDLAIGLNMEDA